MKNRQMNEQLDRIGKQLLRAAVAEEAEVEAAVVSPFIMTRIRAAISEAQTPEESAGWLSLFFVARRAVPAMALVAFVAAISMAWSVQINAPATSAQFDDEALFGAPGPGVEQTVLASRGGPSKDEIFNIVVDRNYGANSK